MEKYIDGILYVRNLFLNFIDTENIKYYNHSYIEIKTIDKLRFIWLKLGNLEYIKNCDLDYFCKILEEQYILNWRLDNCDFDEYNEYYYELIMMLLNIILD